MNKLNSSAVEEFHSISPTGKFESYDCDLSVALGRERQSLDLTKRHPFDVAICRLPKGKINCPYHSHSAQWEFYHVISGKGHVRDESGLHDVAAGDFFVYKPGEAHTVMASADQELIFYVVADNPLGESCHYPDSGKWSVRSPEHRIIRSEPLKYYDGEE